MAQPWITGIRPTCKAPEFTTGQLNWIKQELHQFFDAYPLAPAHLRKLLWDGEINGQSGDHCVVGHTAKLYGLGNFMDLVNALPDNLRPYEIIRYLGIGNFYFYFEVVIFFIRFNDTPANNQQAATLDCWISDWLHANMVTIPLSAEGQPKAKTEVTAGAGALIEEPVSAPAPEVPEILDIPDLSEAVITAAWNRFKVEAGLS